MKTSTLFSLLASLALSSPWSLVAAQESAADAMIANAAADSIDLSVLDFLPAVVAEINEVSSNETARRRRDLSGRQTTTAPPNPNNIVDTHVHFVPSWYKALYPSIGGLDVPDWTIEDQLAFMAGQGISRAIFSFSTPGPNILPGNRAVTIALARALNEVAAAYCRAYPGKFNFYVQVPLPYTQDAIIEMKYAMTLPGAVGVWLQSNAEGIYLGDPLFKNFFQTINSWPGRQIVYVHPSIPYLKVGNQLVEANPTPYLTGKIEFYFETARTLMDLTLSQTIHNFTNIHYVIPHVGGSFPSTMDRILKSYPNIYNSSFNIYSTRFWWDSAGPTYAHQVAGLLGYNIPKTQLLYGTDYPYAPLAPQAGSLAAVKGSPMFTPAEKTAIFRSNAVSLFGNKIAW